MKKITLILGGIRSGKSFFAEQRAERYSAKPVYIATGIPFDKEMRARVELHKKRRGNRYETFEAPYDITGPLAKLREQTVLVDCLTLNLSNRLLAQGEHLELDALIETDEAYLKNIRDIIEKNNLNVIFVSNEVGTAPIADNQLARYFQDLQGRWNRVMAGYANEVYLVSAGIAQSIKKETAFPFKIGAPSYVLPTGYIENVTYLLGKVDDIQLLLFDSRADDPLFKADTLATLEYLARDAGLSYSVHMPVRPKLFDAFDRRLDNSLAVIEQLNRLKISSYTFHFDLPDGEKWGTLPKKEITRIQDRYIVFFNGILEKFPQVNISLENTETPLSALDRVLNRTGISYCIDIGHLLVQDWDPGEINERLSRASVIHLHGWEEINNKKQDHRTVTFNRDLFGLLESYTGILTIENYHKMLFEKSLDVLKDYY